MKKIIILLLAILMLFSSCSFEATLSNIQERFFMSDREQANKYFDKILDAIQYKDVKALKSLFSKKVLTESKDFDTVIDDLFDFVKGEFIVR
jgi:lipoprotein